MAGDARMSPSAGSRRDRLNSEKVAYWYLRLNGFLQIEDFYVHPSGRGGARTDADLLAVRFPHRAERLYDNPEDIMNDDFSGLSLSREKTDIVIAEVKSSQCALNGPWTDLDRKNVHRVLAAIGCFSHDRIERAAERIYETGCYEDETGLRVRLVAIGREENGVVRMKYPNVSQVVWNHLLGFIYDRFRKYRHQKRQTDHWDATGKRLKQRSTQQGMNRDDFIDWAVSAMGVERPHT